MQSSDERRSGSIVSLVALVLAAIHLWVPTLVFDTATLVLLGLAAAPWLARQFKSIEIPGIGKFESQLLETRAAADSASEKAQSALAASGARALSEGESLLALSREYDELRHTLTSSAARTQQLSQVVGRMISSSATLDAPKTLSSLASESPGERLAAYVSLYRSPDPSLAQPLVEVVTEREETGFGQYWGLLAIQQIVARSGHDVLTPKSKERIAAYGRRVPEGTDRHHELRALEAALRFRNYPEPSDTNTVVR
jgi:hypothetical protein